MHHKYIMHEWKYRVECSLCTSDTSWFLDYEFAKNQWNYRPVEDALLARIAELEAIIAYIDDVAPRADETCDEPGIKFSEAVRRAIRDGVAKDDFHG